MTTASTTGSPGHVSLFFAWLHVSMAVLLKMILSFVGFQGVRRHWRTLRWRFAMEEPQERAVVPELAISPILWDPALSGRAPYCSARLITPGQTIEGKADFLAESNAMTVLGYGSSKHAGLFNVSLNLCARWWCPTLLVAY